MNIDKAICLEAVLCLTVFAECLVFLWVLIRNLSIIVIYVPSCYLQAILHRAWIGP